ncbi:MAG: minor capsid protein [Candidatus Gastranaerophilales bacterium]|nr:minor capsid protein [Candidatus Gastranaerophilales bacterium]
MTILNDLKSFLIAQNVAAEKDIAFNFDDSVQISDKLILLCKGGEYSDIARKTTVSVLVKNQLMQNAENIINNAFDKLCPPKQYEKPLSVNGKLMLIKPVQPPFYKEKEKNGRHVFAFEMKIVHKR